MRLDELKLLPEGKGTMLVEFGAWTTEEADAQAERFGAWLATLDPAAELHGVHAARSRRRSGTSANRRSARSRFSRASSRAGKAGKTPRCRPIASGRTCATLFALMREYDYDSPLYGHFGEGCVHMRINFDLETEPGILQFREFIDRAADIVDRARRARFRASTATASRAARCCPRCSVPS